MLPVCRMVFFSASPGGLSELAKFFRIHESVGWKGLSNSKKNEEILGGDTVLIRKRIFFFFF